MSRDITLDQVAQAPFNLILTTSIEEEFYGSMIKQKFLYNILEVI